jgi:hypothetical protein
MSGPVVLRLERRDAPHEIHQSALLLSYDGSSWHVAGVFSLRRDELELVVRALEAGGVEVVLNDAAEPMEAPR